MTSIIRNDTSEAVSNLENPITRSINLPESNIIYITSHELNGNNLFRLVLHLLHKKGNLLTADDARRSNTQSWIVDSEASDYLTGDATVFHKYTTVGIADGALSKVTVVGSVVISKDIVLDPALFFFFKFGLLLSISKLN